jgi:hypothetical protein
MLRVPNSRGRPLEAMTLSEIYRAKAATLAEHAALQS